MNRPVVVSALVLFGLVCPLSAQTNYKTIVKPDLKPLATLKIDGSKIIRTEVADDPGFRIQYHFKKDGKSVGQVEARSSEGLDVPQKEAGTYTVVLELFYPGYKGGTGQKGEFKPISNVLTYKVEPGAKPEEPVKVTLVETPQPEKKPEEKKPPEKKPEEKK
jgi:hypothetical protein